MVRSKISGMGGKPFFKSHDLAGTDIFPLIGSKPIIAITASELPAVLRFIESRGAADTASQAKQSCSQIFRYAIAIGKAECDPAADLRGTLKSTRKSHYPTIIEPGKIGEFLIEPFTSLKGHQDKVGSKTSDNNRCQFSYYCNYPLASMALQQLHGAGTEYAAKDQGKAMPETEED